MLSTHPRTRGATLPSPSARSALVFCCAVAAALAFSRGALAGEAAIAAFKKDIQPILVEYCHDCHGDGSKKGNVAFDAFASEQEMLQKRDLWFAVLKNVRSGIMPPAKKARPSADEIKKLESWIKHHAFEIDPENPDPGRVTLRRLNRVEYRNTIRDLMGIEFKAEEEFAPDDTGYGFDNIGDVLSVSPMLLEKYMQAAQTIVSQAVPIASRQANESIIAGASFRKVDDAAAAEEPPQRGNMRRGNRGESAPMSLYEPHKIAYTAKVTQDGTYRLAFDLFVRGDFSFDPGRAKFTIKVGDREAHAEPFGWDNGKKHVVEIEEKWTAGEYPLTIELEPLTPVEQKKNFVEMRVSALAVRGPMEPEKWVRPKNFDRFFTNDAPADLEGRRAYAREILTKFTRKAFRRPTDAATLDRLISIAENAYTEPGKTFEQGIGQAFLAILASPRFIFRVEDVQPVGAGVKSHPLVDEYALASRLSYFLWSTMPDDELFALAEKGELRKDLQGQVKRMLADPRSDSLIENFAGQWLQARDVDGISIDSRTVLARDNGTDKELAKLFEELRVLRAKREAEQQAQIAAGQPVRERGFGFGGSPEEQAVRTKLRQFQRGPTVELDGALRQAMKRETEMSFEHILREDKTVLDLLDSNYTFLNERLAKHYGIEGVQGDQMRKVELAENSPRGGLITQGSILVVTSNPTRTSPVKRGVFILDHILGAQPPPPPADIPDLEEAEKEFKDKEPTLREVLELHRNNALCSSCHSRMDPLGLALENFNALGMYRESERKLPIDTAGQLITGEKFKDVRELKKILRNDRKLDFYRCMTEKLMTYALGRGLEYYDVESVDKIVQRLDGEDGKFSIMLTGVIESAAFQRRRAAPMQTAEVNKSDQKSSASLDQQAFSN